MAARHRWAVDFSDGRARQSSLALEEIMYYLYGSKGDGRTRLVATFDTEPQLRAYVGWATLQHNPDGTRKFEQGSALVGSMTFEASPTPLTDEDESAVVHNPSPSML